MSVAEQWKIPDRVYAEVVCNRCMRRTVGTPVALSLLDRTPCVSCGRPGDKLITLRSPWGTLKVKEED